MLQRKATCQATPAGVPPVVHEVLREPGQPLDSGTRNHFESRFGQDFSQVRVHHNSRAAESARAVSAQAYTVGRDVVFDDSRYAPHSFEGRKLLAHELTHVVQQDGVVDTSARLRLDNSRGPEEGEAHRVAHTVATNGNARVQRQSGPGSLQRVPIEDPIHEPLIEEFRREHGLPPGGIDERGRRVGPSAGQIKYGGLLFSPCPPIEASHDRENLLEAFCLTSESQDMRPACIFTRSQNQALTAATREASARVNRAHQRITSGAEGRRFAIDMAARLFRSDPPAVPAIVRTLEGMQGYLSGSGPQYAGRTCGDTTCHTALAYVHGAAQLPVYICPRAFIEPDQLFMTVVHEVVHLAGIDADPATPEGYCERFDCITPCLTGDDADAWAHYIACLGEPIRIRTDFLPEIERSIEDLP